ncbi:MAG: tetratricopeptide repeat protein [Bacteroidota bacterium]
MSSSPSGLSIFFKELKRRGVTRVATVYAVVGLGIIEAFDIICGRFLMPDWTIRVIIITVLLGFPVALVISWIYDLTKEGIVKTETLSPSEQASLSVSWKPRWITIILLLVLMLTTTAFFTVPRPNALGFKQQDWILIADLENNTDDPLFDKSLLHALTVTIDQSRRINVYPRSQVDEVLKRMKMDSVERITLPIAFEIAEREGIKAVLLLTISELGGNYVLSTSLIDPRNGQTIRSRQSSATGMEEILPALDKLAGTVRKDLGESLQKIHIKTVPLVKATTPSLEALKCLTNAGNIKGKTNYDEEIELLKEAIELDPEFALAHSNLAAYYYFINKRTKGEEHIAIALGLLDRLTERERLWIQAAVEGYRGNREESVLKWDIFLSQYPDSYGGWFRLGYNYMMMGQMEESIAAFTRALEIYKDDDPSVLVNLATCYGKLQDYDKAIEYYLKTFRVDPDFLQYPSLNHEFGFTYAEAGMINEARSVFEKQLDGNNEQKAMGMRSLALLSMYQGKYSEAIDQIHESTLIYKSIGYGLSELRNRLYLCNIYQAKGMQDEFHAELDHCTELVVEASSEPWWYLILGKMVIRDGDLNRAELLLEEIVSRTNEGNRKDEADYNLLKGEIELHLGKHSEALEYLETANTLHDSPYNQESLAYYYSRLGEWEKAISVCEKMINDYHSLGWEGQECWIRAHLKLGRAYEESRNHAGAMEYYTRILEIWKEADPDLPDLLNVKLRLDQLQAM